MSAFRAVGELAVFVTTYLLLSLVPFLALEPTRVSDLSGWLAQNLVYVAIVGTFGLTILSFVVVASTGIERYIDTLRTPTDPLSIVVGATFLGAAVSWWLLPAIDRAFDLALSPEEIVLLVVVAHLPVVLFLSLLTAAEYVTRSR